MITAYLRAAELLYSELMMDNHSACHIKILMTNQIYVLFLFVCCHTLELFIKLRIYLEMKNSASAHRLSGFYSSFIYNSSESKNNTELSALAEVLNEIDACKFRYSKDKNDRGLSRKKYLITANKILQLTRKPAIFL